MRKFFIITAAGLMLAACGTVSNPALFKRGTDAPQKQYDLDQCKIASLKTIPQQFTTTVTGSYYTPGNIFCDTGKHGGTSCYQDPGLYIAPSSYTVDQNANLRWRFVQGCLQKKGYNIIEKLRSCTSQQERQQAMKARMVSQLTCNPDPSLDY